MAVVAMIGKHDVAGVGKRANDSHLAEFLPDAGVRGSGKQPLGEQLKQHLFRSADEQAIGIGRAGFARYGGLAPPIAREQARFFRQDGGFASGLKG